MADDGPVENFFKVMADDGDWFYIAVVPLRGPYIGSIVPGDDLDRHARYQMIKDEGFSQEWYQRNADGEYYFAAPGLP